MTDQPKAGRKPTGTVTKTRDGRLQGIVTLADGSRKRLPPFPKGTSREMARERTKFHAAEVLRRGIVRLPKAPATSDAAPGETIERYLGRLFDHRKVRGLKRQNVERGRLRKHVEPVLTARGVQTMLALDVDDCRAIVEALDQKIAEGEIEASTAGKTWALWKTVCAEACGSKVAALRIRDTNPCATVRGPEKAQRKARQWLYPNEFSALVTCEDVPLRWRRLYALTVYMCLRAGELGALECEDIDLEHGRVRVHRSMDREPPHAIGPTKTGDVRTLDVPRELVALLAVMVKERGETGRLVDFPPFEDLASNLRKHLKRAGVKRRELHERTDTSTWVVFHDLRGTGISWLAMMPELTPYDVRDYAGHSELSTTDLYVRRGRKARGLVGEPFPALPVSLLGAVSFDHEIDHTGPASESGIEHRSALMASPTGFEPVLQP